VTLLSGYFFGELALLYLSPRNASIRAREYCDLYALHKHDFDKVLQLHPDFAAEVERMALSRKKD
jgi:CRP-like cAMP-binding protein